MSEAAMDLRGATGLRAFTMRLLFQRLIGVYVFMLILLPSGSIFGLNVKILWFFLLLPIAIRFFFKQHQGTPFRLTLLFAIPGGLLCWFLLAQYNGFEPIYGLEQYKDLMVTILSCWFVALFCAEGQLEKIYLLRVVVFAEVTTSLLKVLMLIYSFWRGIPVTQLIESIKSIFGVSLMTLDFESMLGRIQFISDGVIPVCIFAILRYRRSLRFSSWGAVCMLLLMLASDFFAFSRYFWGYTVLAVVLGLLFGKKDLFQLCLIGVLGTVSLAVLPTLTTIISLRFSTNLVASSDQDRVAQVRALDDFFASAPVLGHGLGSYTTRLTRNEDAPYTYEDQLLALAGQVSVLGLALLSALMTYYFRDLYVRQQRGWIQSVVLTVMLIGWICAGLFNPEVISSAASVCYAALAAMAGLSGDSGSLSTKPGQPLAESLSVA